MAASQPRVSVIIKAYNEEAKITLAIESALAAVAAVDGGGEVILADSLSTDGTVETARAYPVRIVQLIDGQDRSCGVGAQLGMVAARGEFLYILDGDMELTADFLPQALARFDADPELAGVAGQVQEMHVVNQVFLRRQQSGETTTPGRDLVCLNMGGLYRRAAVAELGYLTNRNLHAFEEFELGVRLVDAGWRLERIAVTAVRHYGHTDSTYALLWRRWRSRHAWGHGELLRQAWKRSHLPLAVRHLRLYRVAGFVAGSWLGLALLAWARGLTLPWAVAAAAGYWSAVFAVMAVRKRSLPAAAYSLVAWHFTLAGLVRGLVAAPRTAAEAPVAHRVLQ